MKKHLFLFLAAAALFLTACTGPGVEEDTVDTPTGNEIDMLPEDDGDGPSRNEAEGPSVDQPAEGEEIPLSDELILKYYDLFSETAPGFMDLGTAVEGGFTGVTFASPEELTTDQLLVYAVVNLDYRGQFVQEEQGLGWRMEDVTAEIQRGFDRTVTDFSRSGYVTVVPEEGLLVSTGWSGNESLASPQLTKLTRNSDGSYTGEFAFYGVLDYILEVGSLKVREEIVKDYSEALNSPYCVKIMKTITFLENKEGGETWLQFLSME